MTTPELKVQVATQYVEEQSDPSRNQFVFAYTITITNTGDAPAQLISRHWIITDGNNRVEEVKGLGVVGHQPFLKPGQSFEYTSGCPLSTPFGTMRGAYRCVTEEGDPFDADIPEFALGRPGALH